MSRQLPNVITGGRSSGPVRQDTQLRWARPAAILWTLLILGACFVPGSEIPEVDVPLADKWVHMVLFGVFAFLWLRTKPLCTLARLFAVCLITALFGYGVELLQGALHEVLGRTYSKADALADAIGGVLGTFAFWLMHRIRRS